MFNKKRKAAKQQERMEARARKVTEFTDEIAAVQDIKDPAERFLKLTEIENSMIWHEGATLMGAKFHMGRPLSAGSALTSLGMIGGAIALGPFAPHVAVGMALFGMGPSLVVGAVGDAVRNKHLGKVQTAEVKPHLETIKRLAKQVAEMKETLIGTQKEEIVRSPAYEKVLALPGLAEKFSGAAAKQAENLQREVDETKKATQRQKRAASASKPSLRRYDRLKGPFDTRQ